MGAIFRKEMRTYFTTISGYGFLGFFALITGYFFIGQNIVGSSANYNDTLTGSMIMFLILVPVLTMRLFAEESRQKTDQLLYSVPIKVTSIVAIIDKIIELATASLTPTSSLAPYFCEISTANPLVSPITNPFTKNTIELVVPTAANASTPINLPTIIVSTIL